MTAFLQICKDVARESGTFPTIGDPATTVDQSGRLARLVAWVQTAYREIQLRHNNWRWLEAEVSGPTIAGTQRYNAAALGISERFGRWLLRDDKGCDLFTIYLTADGQATERPLRHVPWPEFRRDYLVGSGTTDTGYPASFSIDQDQKVVLHPVPDAAYTVRGMYYKAPQTLTADVDVPEMPEEFHDAVQWRALLLLGIFDESPIQMPEWKRHHDTIMHRLELNQLPAVELEGSLL